MHDPALWALDNAAMVKDEVEPTDHPQITF